MTIQERLHGLLLKLVRDAPRLGRFDQPGSDNNPLLLAFAGLRRLGGCGLGLLRGSGFRANEINPIEILFDLVQRHSQVQG